MNKLIIIGNLTRDPEVRYTKGKDSTDLALAHFSVAVNNRLDDTTDYFNCVAFGKRAEFVEKYFSKGSRIVVCGRVRNDNYTNKNGEKVYGFQVLATEVEFGSTGKGTENQDSKKDNKTNADSHVSDDFFPADDVKLPFE